MLSDIVIPLWKARLDEKDVGGFRIKLNIGGDVIASLMVVRVEEFGFFCKNVHLNLEYIDEFKYVSHCNFKEFVEYYGDVFMYLLDNNGQVDINQIYNI